MYYCKYYIVYKGTLALVQFQDYLKEHKITITATAESALRKAFNNIIKDIFRK